MCKIIVLNTTAINVSQLSHLNINSNLDRGEMGVYANLINGQKLFLQKTEGFDDAVILLKKFSQLCNGTYRAPTPVPNSRRTPPLPEYNPNK